MHSLHSDLLRENRHTTLRVQQKESLSVALKPVHLSQIAIKALEVEMGGEC